MMWVYSRHGVRVCEGGAAQEGRRTPRRSDELRLGDGGSRRRPVCRPRATDRCSPGYSDTVHWTHRLTGALGGRDFSYKLSGRSFICF